MAQGSMTQKHYQRGYQTALSDVLAAFLRDGETEALGWLADNIDDPERRTVLENVLLKKGTAGRQKNGARLGDETAVEIPVRMSKADFHRLSECAAPWTISFHEQIAGGRFERDENGSDVPSTHWKWAYWVGHNASALLMARSYLEVSGFDYQVFWDLATHDNGMPLGYVILTDLEHGTCVMAQQSNPTLQEGFPVINGLPLRLSFTAEAIREHFECDDTEESRKVENLTDDELAVIGAQALSSDRVYDTFHAVLVAAVEAHRGTT